MASGLSASIGGAGVGAHGQALAGSFLIYVLFVGGIAALTGRASAWTLRIMWELDSPRTAHARLSVAEERLRFRATALELRSRDQMITRSPFCTQPSSGAWSLLAWLP